MEAVDWPFSSRRSAGAGTEADLRTLGERRPRPPPSVAHSCKVSPAGAAVEQACRDYCSDPPTTPLAVTRITPTRGGGRAHTTGTRRPHPPSAAGWTQPPRGARIGTRGCACYTAVGWLCERGAVGCQCPTLGPERPTHAASKWGGPVTLGP